MFCYQCQETVKNVGCTIKGVCGKDESTANLQDLLIYFLQGIALCAETLNETISRRHGVFMCQALFSTITNANFDENKIIELIKKAVRLRDELKSKNNVEINYDAVKWTPDLKEDFKVKASNIGILSYSDNEDIRSLKSLLLYGMKGISAYTDHAAILGYYNDKIFTFLVKGLAALTKDISDIDLITLVLEAGENAVEAMKLLDKANTETYGNPEMTKVNIGVRSNPGILISGHDLKDMHELLQQTEGTGIDVYTHSEMLPANYYPKLKQYKHFIGNYGGSWWHQNKEFESFNGPIIMTTNCIVPVKDTYKDRIFTTGMTGYPGVKHISDRANEKQKDFSEVIKLARQCLPPNKIEEGEIIGGFAHSQVLALSDEIIKAVKSGAIKHFIVMAGCDGRHPTRKYFTEVAQNLPRDTVILTAGCAKYRYNKLNLGDINGIPRVLDAGQCNDSFSLVTIALKLKDAFKLNDVNDLPLSFDIAWYEQKAVAVLLALLYLGFKKIRLGPTVPAFLSANVAKVITEKFELKPIDNPEDDIQAMLENNKILHG